MKAIYSPLCKYMTYSYITRKHNSKFVETQRKTASMVATGLLGFMQAIYTGLSKQYLLNREEANAECAG